MEVNFKQSLHNELLKKYVGVILQRYRLDENQLAKNAAFFIGIDAGNLSRIETGKYLPSVHILSRIVSYYNHTLTDLFFDVEQLIKNYYISNYELDF